MILFQRGSILLLTTCIMEVNICSVKVRSNKLNFTLHCEGRFFSSAFASEINSFSVEQTRDIQWSNSISISNCVYECVSLESVAIQAGNEQISLMLCVVAHKSYQVKLALQEKGVFKATEPGDGWVDYQKQPFITKWWMLKYVCTV